MRFKGDYDFYCSVLGRSVHVRSWDRLIVDLDLEGCGMIERRQRVRAIARIRAVKPKASASPLIAESYLALEALKKSITSDDGLNGQQVYELVSQIRAVSFRQIQRWGEPHGLRLAATRMYQGSDLSRWIEVVIRNASSVRAKKTAFEKVVEVLHEVN